MKVDEITCKISTKFAFVVTVNAEMWWTVVMKSSCVSIYTSTTRGTRNTYLIVFVIVDIVTVIVIVFVIVDNVILINFVVVDTVIVIFFVFVMVDIVSSSLLEARKIC